MRLRATRMTGMRQGSMLSFAISSLFANGERGVYFDAADTVSMYQDAEGLIPVTSVEQPVGLWLDKSQGSTIFGGNQVVNGGFDVNLSGWIVGSGISWSSGGAVLGAGAGFLTQAISTEAGRVYRVTGSATGNPVYCGAWLTSGQGTNLTTPTGVSTAAGRSGTFSFLFVAIGATSHISFTATGSGAVTLDNVTVLSLPKGNHAYQPTSTKRPILSAKYNTLNSSEQITSGAPWVASAFTINNNNLPCPTGPAYLAKITATASPGVTYHYTSAPSSAFRVAMYVAVGTRPYIELLIRNGTTATNYQSGYIDGAGTMTGGSWVATPLGGGIFRVETTVTTGFSSGDILMIYYGATNTVTPGLFWYAGGMDVRSLSDGVNIPDYQRVNTATDYETNGFPKYLKFDGVDDFLQTPSIDFSITDKVTVFSGIRKLRDSSRSVVVEFGEGQIRTFGMSAPTVVNSPEVTFVSAGAAYATAFALGLPSPKSLIATAIADIAASSVQLRINGALSASNTNPQGGGNYTAAPVFIGMRGGYSHPFNGRIYGIVIRGAATDAATIAKAENVLNSAAKIY